MIKNQKNKPLKAGSTFLIISTLLAVTSRSIAAPTDGVVTSGNATISQSGDVTDINQSSNKATINWNSFSTASDETVNFNQPDINSITLNRVIGSEKSIINGALNANGQVWLLNSNGVLFGSSAKVNTSGLLAVTKNLSDTDFNNNNYSFKGDSTNSVINLGTIDIANSGYATLAAKSVTNEGTINAIKGTIHLVGANEVTINLNGNSMLNLTIDKGILDALVKNSGSLYANAGEVYLTTNAVNDLLKGVVNNSGIIEAQSLGGVTGKIELFAHGGEVQVGGTLKAKDGFIETSGKEFSIADGTLVQTGNWLIDPTNITIDSTLASTLQTQLASGNAQVTTTAAGSDSGDINVNSSIAWSANTLTLHADNDININATLNATATAGLALEYAQTIGTGTYNIKAPVNLASTGSFSTKKGTAAAINYTILNSLGAAGSTTATDLQGINGNKTGNYVLGSNIDASATSTWNAGAGWNPLGSSATDFRGRFDGLGHTVSNIFINRPSTVGVGFFGVTNFSSFISNLGLVSVSITGNSNTGGFVGSSSSTISNSYATGSVTGGGSSRVGGFVGNGANGTISDSYSTVNVSGGAYVGGFVGDNFVTISNSYATGNVSATNFRSGGFVGWNHQAISNAYATGNVSGTSITGGFVGDNRAGISNAYATGKVTGTSTSSTGGFVGSNEDSITNSFWDTETSEKTTSDGGTGLTTAQMKDTKTFYDAGWNLNTIWGRDTNNVKNSGYLDLRALNSFDFNTIVTMTVTDQSKVYDGTAGITATFNKTNIVNSATAFTKNVGSNAFTSSSSNYGYTYDTGYNSNNTEVLIYNSGSATITKKALTLSGITGNNKVYDGTTDATASATLTGLIAGDTLTITSTFDNKNVGTGKTLTLNSLTGTDGANYSATLGQTTTADVTKKALSLSGISASNKVYDATKTATSTATLNGVISGDTVSNTITSTFDNKNAGTAKTVTLDSVTLAGTDSTNYSIASGQTTTADVTQKALSLSGISASNKVYDGTKTATASATLAGVIAGDTVSNTIASSFDNKNAGTAKTVTLDSVTLAGTDSANYSIASGQTTTADVTKKALTLSGISANNKIYDGATTATASATLTGLIAGDIVSNTIASTFDNKNAGTAKTVTLNSLTGADSANYSIASGQTTTADVTKKALTLSGITANNKIYDATTTATTTATLTGIIAGDTVSNTITSTFDNKNAGTAKTVTLDSVTLAGTDSANYSIAAGQTTTADITQKALTLSGISANNKVYDATTTATTTATLTGIIAGDTVSNTITSTFDNKNAGTAKTVTLDSVTLAGADSANYSIAAGQTTTADITAVHDTVLENIISTIFNDAALTSNPIIQPVIPVVNTSPYGASALGPVDQSSKVITLRELNEANNDNSNELRTPVYEDFPLTLVNNGIHMPTDVDQQFFVPEGNNEER